MNDTSHLVALQERLSRERERLKQAKTDDERVQRQVWVAQAERELEGELKFLGMATAHAGDFDDDTLLAELEMVGKPQGASRLGM